MVLDKKFVKRLQNRDRQAYGEFYKQTVDQLYRYVAGRYSLSKGEIQDLVSDFYLKLRKVIDKYDDSYKFESFFRTVFRNMLKDSFKKKREKHDDVIVHNREMTDPDDLLRTIQGKYQITAIRAAMENLDEVSYQVITMRYIEQMEYSEISSFLGVKESAVRQRLSRALRKIKDELR